jgi:hypothetical protein
MSENTRVQVPLDPETLLIMQEYAKVKGLALGRACSDVLQSTGPVLAELTLALRDARNAPAKALRESMGVLDKQVHEIDQMRLDMAPRLTDGRSKKKAS